MCAHHNIVSQASPTHIGEEGLAIWVHSQLLAGVWYVMIMWLVLQSDWRTLYAAM